MAVIWKRSAFESTHTPMSLEPHRLSIITDAPSSVSHTHRDTRFTVISHSNAACVNTAKMPDRLHRPRLPLSARMACAVHQNEARCVFQYEPSYDSWDGCIRPGNTGAFKTKRGNSPASAYVLDSMLQPGVYSREHCPRVYSICLSELGCVCVCASCVCVCTMLLPSSHTSASDTHIHATHTLHPRVWQGKPCRVCGKEQQTV
jgi:hypothetical protein